MKYVFIKQFVRDTTEQLIIEDLPAIDVTYIFVIF